MNDRPLEVGDRVRYENRDLTGTSDFNGRTAVVTTIFGDTCGITWDDSGRYYHPNTANLVLLPNRPAPTTTHSTWSPA